MRLPSELLQTLDVPFGEPVSARRFHDPSDIGGIGRAAIELRCDVAQSGLEIATEGFGHYGPREIDPAQDLSSMPIEPIEFGVSRLGENPVHSVLIGGHQVGQGTNRDVEAREACNLEPVRHEIDFPQHSGIDIGPVEEGDDVRLEPERCQTDRALCAWSAGALECTVPGAAKLGE